MTYLDVAKLMKAAAWDYYRTPKANATPAQPQPNVQQPPPAQVPAQSPAPAPVVSQPNNPQSIRELLQPVDGEPVRMPWRPPRKPGTPYQFRPLPKEPNVRDLLH